MVIIYVRYPCPVWQTTKHLNSTMTPSIQLWLQFSYEWVPILSIPRDQFALYTTRPLKWLRYLGFVIYGREGVLRATRDGPEIDDYTIVDMDSLLVDYFYHSPGKLRPIVATSTFSD
jgi:hypothetical protein